MELYLGNLLRASKVFGNEGALRNNFGGYIHDSEDVFTML
jgi:hypothetical protein